MPINSFETYPMSWRPSRREIERRAQPFYKALAAQLMADIESGTILPGTKLPPQRELADFLDVNVSTVSKAFRYCSNGGFLTSVVGRGTFVAYDAGMNVSVAPDRTSLIEMGSMMPERLTGDAVAALVSEMMGDPSREDFSNTPMGPTDFIRKRLVACWQRSASYPKDRSYLPAVVRMPWRPSFQPSFAPVTVSESIPWSTRDSKVRRNFLAFASFPSDSRRGK